MDLKTRIEQVLSEIYSDKYDCKVTLKFMPREKYERIKQEEERGKTA